MKLRRIERTEVMSYLARTVKSVREKMSSLGKPRPLQESLAALLKDKAVVSALPSGVRASLAELTSEQDWKGRPAAISMQFASDYDAQAWYAGQKILDRWELIGAEVVKLQDLLLEVPAQSGFAMLESSINANGLMETLNRSILDLYLQINQFWALCRPLEELEDDDFEKIDPAIFKAAPSDSQQSALLV